MISGNNFQYSREKGNKGESFYDDGFVIFTNSIEGGDIVTYIRDNEFKNVLLEAALLAFLSFLLGKKKKKIKLDI